MEKDDVLCPLLGGCCDDRCALMMSYYWHDRHLKTCSIAVMAEKMAGDERHRARKFKVVKDA